MRTKILGFDEEDGVTYCKLYINSEQFKEMSESGFLAACLLTKIGNMGQIMVKKVLGSARSVVKNE